MENGWEDEAFVESNVDPDIVDGAYTENVGGKEVGG